jgi:hypothetical protein
LYACKDEELTVIAGFVTFSLKRDEKDFASYSHIFSKDFVKKLETESKEAASLVRAGSRGTSKLKTSTKALYGALDGLAKDAQRLKGYIKLAGASIEGGVKSFGITKLSTSVNRRDAEGVLAELKTLEELVEQNKAALKAAGMTDSFLKKLKEAPGQIQALNQAQYESRSQRGHNVADNIERLNSLYVRISAVLDVGKIIYKGVNPTKVKEYTFSELKKRVRGAGGAAGAEKKERKAE